MKISQMSYARPEYGFTHNGRRNYQIWFVPAITINCKPPYIAGKMDCCWVRVFDKPLPKTTDQEGWERRLGMSLLPMKDEEVKG
jgi:hypothetical protein